MNQSFFARRSFAIMLALFFALPFIWMGTRRAIESNRNDVKDWLPREFPETATHRWFQEHFPHEQFVLVSWEGCTLDDPRLEFFAERLYPPEGPPEESWFFKAPVLTGVRLIEQLQQRYADLSEDEILRRLEGSLIGEDHNKTCLVVTLSEAAKGKNLRPALDKIREIAHQSCAIPVEDLKLGGPPVDNVAIDVEGERTLYRLAFLSAVLGLGISWLCFRSFRLTGMVFSCAILAAGIGLALVYFTGSAVDAVLMSMPSLVYVLAISGSIHIINYYHDAIREEGLERGPELALSHGWIPCSLAAVTTSLGLGSLYVSQIIPIKKFGLYSALGVLATLVLLFLVLPACLAIWPSRSVAEQTPRRSDGQPQESIFVRLWSVVGRNVIRHNVLVSTGCLLMMALFVVGLFRIQTSVKLMKFFSPGAEIIEHYGWLEEQLGPLVPMEVVIRVDNQKCDLTFLQRMRLVRDVEHVIEQLDDVGGALSAATFAPELGPRRFHYTIADSVLSKRLEEHRCEFHEYLALDSQKTQARAEGQLAEELHDPGLEELGLDEDVVHRLKTRRLLSLQAIKQYGAGGSIEDKLASIRGIDAQQAAEAAAAIERWEIAHGEDLWRVSARVWALTDLDYGEFVEELRSKVEPVLKAYRAAGFSGIDATYTGLVPLVYKTQHELMRGLRNSLAMAFVLIALVMMVVLKSPRAGLLSMVPNVFPVVVIFGFMGWAGILVDVGTMMTASVALGVAVDDTLHYLFWFRKGLDGGRDRKGAAMWAYRRCATAMSQTTLIGGLGLAAFAFSTFTPTQRFGVLMLSLLSAALVGDLIFLPAILSGPLGRFFDGRKKGTSRPPSEGDADDGQDAETDLHVVGMPVEDKPATIQIHPGSAHRSHKVS